MNCNRRSFILMNVIATHWNYLYPNECNFRKLGLKRYLTFERRLCNSGGFWHEYFH